ncbi:hypothetical protein ACSBR2_018071 [Camellia fascicularis]
MRDHLLQVWSVGPQVRNFPVEERRATVYTVFDSFSKPESGERATAYLLSVWTDCSEGHVYVVTTPRPSVVRGNFLLCNSITNVLIDINAFHSFISSAFVSVLGLEVARLTSPLRVESPVSGEVVLDRGC